MTLHTARVPLLFLALIVQAAFWVWVLPPNHDEGWLLHAAMLSEKGLAPYLDYGFTQGPALPAIFAAAQKVLGHGLVSGRVWSTACGFLTVVCVYDSVRRLSGVRPALLVLVLVVLDPYLVAQYCQVKTYSIAGLGVSFTVWSWVATRWTHENLRSFAVFAGSVVLCITALGVRLSLVPVLGVWLWAAFGRSSKEGGLATLGALAGGCLSTVAAWSSTTDIFWWNVFEVHLGPWLSEGGLKPFWMVGQTLGMVGFMAWVVVVWVGVALWTARTASGPVRWRGPRGLPLVGMFVAASLAHLVPGGGHGEYVVVVWPCLAVLAGCWASQAARVRPLVGGCIAGLIIVHWGLSWARLGPIVELGGPAKQTREIGQVVKAALSPEQRVLSFHPLVAVEAQRLLVDGLEMGPFSLVMEDGSRAWGRVGPGEVLSALESHSTGAVLTSERDFLHDAYNRGIDPKLAAAMRASLAEGARRRFGDPQKYESLGQFGEAAFLYIAPSSRP